MSIQHNNNIFKHTVSFSGLSIELVSDNMQLLELNFIKGNKISDNDTIPGPIKKAISYLDDYFHCKKSKMDIVLNTKIPGDKLTDKSKKLYLDMRSYTEKENHIYSELLKVPPGKTVSYNELAQRSSIIRGGRFAGNCMAGNMFPIIIPCHRVIKSDGSTGNYTGGVDIKEFLLKHEKENSFSKK